MSTHDVVTIINALTPLVKELGVIISAAASIFAAWLIWKTGRKVDTVVEKTDLNHEIALANREALASVVKQTDGMQRALQDGAFREGRTQGQEEAKVGGAELLMRDNTAAQDAGELRFRRRWSDKAEDAARALATADEVAAGVVQKVDGAR